MLLENLVSAFVGALTGVIAAYVTSFLKFRQSISSSTLEKRYSAYTAIWEKTGLLPKWPKSSDVTYNNLGELETEFRDWYFKVGGILLSHNSRRKYGDMQEVLDMVFNSADDKEKTLSATDYEKVRKACSSLRTALTKDLLSRKGVGGI